MSLVSFPSALRKILKPLLLYFKALFFLPVFHPNLLWTCSHWLPFPTLKLVYWNTRTLPFTAKIHFCFSYPYNSPFTSKTTNEMSSFPAVLDPVSGRSDTNHREHPIKVSTTLPIPDVYRMFSINISDLNQPYSSYSSVASSPILGCHIHASNSSTSLSNLPFKTTDSTSARSSVLRELKYNTRFWWSYLALFLH